MKPARRKRLKRAAPHGGGGEKALGIFWAVCLLVLVLGACAASKMDYALIDQGSHAAKRFPSLQMEVAADREAFEKLYAEIHADRLPPPDRPEIDFQNWLVVFISAGEKPTAGHRLTVREVTRTKETATIKITLEEPPSDEMQAMVITQPFAVVKIKKEPGLKKIALIDANDKVLQTRPIGSGAN